MDNQWFCCDWGSTNLRLYLVEDQEVIDEKSTSIGAKKFNLLCEQRNIALKNRIHLAQELLSELIGEFSIQKSKRLIIISGMASSSLGLKELPYSPTPFKLDGSKLDFHHFKGNNDFLHDIYLLSGCKHHHDVMRGEEVQLMGLSKDHTHEMGRWILPGTHSKHIWIQNHEILEFHTYMTGELFELLSSQSTLMEGMEKLKGAVSEEEWEAFEEGVICAQKASLSRQLFQVRSRRNEFSGRERTLLLSGMLIGAEIGQLAHEKTFILGQGLLTELYCKAFDLLNIKAESAPKGSSPSVVLGQYQWLQTAVRNRLI